MVKLLSGKFKALFALCDVKHIPLPIEEPDLYRFVYRFPFKFKVIYRPDSPYEQVLGTF